MTEGFDLPEEFDLEPEDFAVAEEAQATPEFEFASLLLTGGDRVYFPIVRNEDGEVIPQSIMEAALEAGLSIPAGTQFWTDNVQVNPNSTLIASNMTITAIGNVKGGK